MSDIHVMRDALSRLYGPVWNAKVKKMTDNQVIAIYKKFKLEGKIK
jgi:hypothetical protein